MQYRFRGTICRDVRNDLIMSAVKSAGILVILLVARGRACCQVLYQTGFEAPTFTAGSSVDGQGGFAVTFGAPSAITVSTTQPYAGAQDLLFTGSALSAMALYGPNYFIGTAGIAPNYDTSTGNSEIIMQAALQLDGPSTATGVGATGDLVSINLEAILGDGSYFSTYLSSDGNAYGFSYGNTFAHYDASTPVTLDTYYYVGLAIDFSDRMTTYFVDGQAIGSVAFDPSVDSTVLSSAQLSLYVDNQGAPANPDDYSALADDFSVVAVPEPSPLTVCLIGALGTMTLIIRQRRIGRKLLR